MCWYRNSYKWFLFVSSMRRKSCEKLSIKRYSSLFSSKVPVLRVALCWLPPAGIKWHDFSDNLTLSLTFPPFSPDPMTKMLRDRVLAYSPRLKLVDHLFFFSLLGWFYFEFFCRLLHALWYLSACPDMQTPLDQLFFLLLIRVWICH